jgi:hypothetical protein
MAVMAEGLPSRPARVGIGGKRTVAAGAVTGYTGQNAARGITICIELFALGCVGFGDDNVSGIADAKKGRAQQQAAGNKHFGKHTLHEDLDGSRFGKIRYSFKPAIIQ